MEERGRGMWKPWIEEGNANKPDRYARRLVAEQMGMEEKAKHVEGGHYGSKKLFSTVANN